MCGIAGLIDARRSPAECRESVQRMCEQMRHRGPDDGGIANRGVATLGMRRLAIFDPAHGRQPMQTPDGRYTLVFNGALYNFRDLRAELQTLGHAFKTECDTEVLLAAFAQWQSACLQRLRGMFAFAVWDAHEETLTLARDPFGIKPVYFHLKPDGALIFGSELNALLASGLVPSAISPGAVNAYLSYLAVPAPETIYENVFSLRAGEVARWHAGKLTLQSYWTIRDAHRSNAPTIARSSSEFRAGLRAQLEDSVRAHTLADVPVGAFLSGGLDSTALVALMTHLSGRKLKTFSLGFDDAAYSESNAAEVNSRFLGTTHHSTVLTGRQAADDIESILAAMDHPTGDGINTYYVSQAAREGGVTVAISGLGADELFGGYPSFDHVVRMSRWLPVWRALPSTIRTHFLSQWDTGDTRHRKLADALRHGTNPAALALLQRRVFSEADRKALLSSDARRPYHPHPLEATLDQALPSGSRFDRVSAAELGGYMADVLLRDSDMMSMRHSLELRVPFVDLPLVTWLARQRVAFKSTPRRPKAALADAVQDLIPPSLLRRPKRGFTLPFAVWMRGPLRPFLDDVFSSSSVSRSGLFIPVAVQTAWQRFLARDDSREWSRLWSLAVLIAFINRPRPTAP